jgi:hypothetical protein
MPPNAKIEEAEGFAELGMFVDAWEVIESLPSDHRSELGADAVRLWCFISFQKWDEVEALVNVLRLGCEQRKLLAATGLKSLALGSACRRDFISAKDFIQQAMSISPEIRLAISRDPIFSDLA